MVRMTWAVAAPTLSAQWINREGVHSTCGLVTLRHVLAHGRMPVRGGTARVGGDALAGVEDLDCGGGIARFELLASQLVGKAIVMPVDFDVIVDGCANRLPLGHYVGFRRQQLKGWAVQFRV